MGELISVMRQFVEAQVAPKVEVKSPRAAKPVEPAQPSKAEPKAKPAATETRGRKRGEDDEIINQAISAIIAYNDEEERRHDEKWLLTANLLKKFTAKGNQRAAERGLQERAEAIHAHHQKHQLQHDHNNRHKKHDVRAIVLL
jgi:hypothetical protein